ncbi:HAD family hydrolase [Flavobacteriaceae bacterium M23B6Z8]
MNEKLQLVVFDLDDTLYKELDFLESAYKEIAVFLESRIRIFRSQIYKEMIDWYYEGENVFRKVLERYPVPEVDIHTLLTIYRNHVPDIQLSKDHKTTLDSITRKEIPIAIMTDGRSLQQRNKIKVLGLESYTKEILISEEFGSEKPDRRNYEYFMKAYPGRTYYYIGDNTKKDFVTANSLGWITICLLDDGNNIHEQDFSLPDAHLPAYQIKNIKESMNYIQF